MADNGDLWTNGHNGVTGTDGKNVVEIDAQNGVLSQTIQTEAGKAYGITFDYAGQAGALASSAMQVLWNGVVIATINPTDAAFHNHHIHAHGTGGNDVLAFRAVEGDTDGVGGLLDKVVVAVSDHPVVNPPVDTISGTAGNDELFDTAGNDTINAGDGNDTIVLGSGGNDTVDGGAGIDGADFHGSASDYVITKNADGTTTVSNAAYGTDTLKNIETLWFAGEERAYDIDTLTPSNPPVDTISGTAGNDELFDTAANDTINAGDGNDTIVLGSGGNDTVDGGAGIDGADFHGSASDYVITKNADGTTTVSNAAYGTDTLKNIETLWFAGEERAYDIDTLTPGSPPAGTISGTAGNDELFDTAANDTINAGDGNDTIVLGSRGNDTVDGGAGVDSADFHGAASDYSFTSNADGTITVSNAAYGTDTLKNIETLWFAGEAKAYDVAELVPPPDHDHDAMAHATVVPDAHAHA